MRVLILLSDTGGGHRSVARAVAAGLRQVAGDAVDPAVVDVFALGRLTLHDRLTRLYEPILRRWPALYGALYHLFDRPAVYDALVASARRGLRPKVCASLAESRPDLVISVHPLANRLALEALREVDPRVPLTAVVTELVSVHRSWVEPGIARYTVATAQAHRRVLQLGAPADRVILTGLPVDERCAAREPGSRELRRQLGLDPDLFTALFIGGGVGAGGLGERVSLAARSGLDGQVVVVCGRNEALRERLAIRRFPIPVRALGFVSNVPELMRAADVVVSKSGPQTLAEALACGRPVLVYRELAGQEEGNGAFIAHHGAGYFLPDPTDLAAALRRLAADPSELARLRDGAVRLGRPEAATKVAEAILGLAGVPA